MQVDVSEVIRFMSAGIGVGIVLSFLPWLVGMMISFAINLFKKS